MSEPDSGITAEQYGFLTSALNPKRVKHVQGQAHLEAWDVRRHLIRCFGFAGWDFVQVTCDLIADKVVPADKPNGHERYTVIYRYVGRLIVKAADGCPLAVYEDGAVGDAVNQPSLGDAHDLALKSAISGALKRCAVNLGDQFGLSLYRDGSVAAVVQRSLVAPAAGDDDGAHRDARPEVVGMGDYDPNNPAAIKRQARELVAKREVIAGMSEQEDSE
jgi:recombination DNA repair RAD52 pathway protein